MNIQFMGAARAVTGSCYIVETAGARFAIDCGMYQGNSEMEKRNYDTSVYRPEKIDFVLLTHAHIDHSGLLPRLVRDGFTGKIYCTPPTADLVGMMLEDSGHIQELEALWRTKHKARGGETDKREALYTVEDALKVPAHISQIAYDKEFSPCPGLKVVYRNAGHILGSAFVQLMIEEDGKPLHLLFSGDIGRPGTLLMYPPKTPDIDGRPDYIFMESTYGDRNHKDEDDSLNELLAAILYAHANNEKVIIPAFAVGRTQEILYSLFLLHKAGRLPNNLPIYVDSPLAIKATKIFAKYKDYLNAPELEVAAKGEDYPLPNLHFTLSTEQSQALNNDNGPGVILAASGMCNAGRIKHHLRHNAWKPGAAIVFVGYQGAGTPGRRIVDGAKSIRLFNEEVAIKAKIFTIGGFSAHAGQSQLLAWLDKARWPGLHVVLTHGENKAILALSKLIEERFSLPVTAPFYLEKLSLKSGTSPVLLADTVQGVSKISETGIDWDYLIKTTDTQMTALREKLLKTADKDFDKQVEVRDRLLDLKREMDILLSQI